MASMENLLLFNSIDAFEDAAPAWVTLSLILNVLSYLILIQINHADAIDVEVHLSTTFIFARNPCSLDLGVEDGDCSPPP